MQVAKLKDVSPPPTDGIVGCCGEILTRSRGAAEFPYLIIRINAPTSASVSEIRSGRTRKESKLSFVVVNTILYYIRCLYILEKTNVDLSHVAYNSINMPTIFIPTFLRIKWSLQN